MDQTGIAILKSIISEGNTKVLYLRMDREEMQRQAYAIENIEQNEQSQRSQDVVKELYERFAERVSEHCNVQVQAFDQSGVLKVTGNLSEHVDEIIYMLEKNDEIIGYRTEGNKEGKKSDFEFEYEHTPAQNHKPARKKPQVDSTENNRILGYLSPQTEGTLVAEGNPSDLTSSVQKESSAEADQGQDLDWWQTHLEKISKVKLDKDSHTRN